MAPAISVRISGDLSLPNKGTIAPASDNISFSNFSFFVFSQNHLALS